MLPPPSSLLTGPGQVESWVVAGPGQAGTQVENNQDCRLTHLSGVIVVNSQYIYTQHNISIVLLSLYQTQPRNVN